MKRSIVVIFLLLTGCEGAPHPGPLPARRGEGKEACVNGWERVATGIEYRTLNCTASGFDLHLVRVDPKIAKIDAVTRPGSTATDLGREFVFAQNANFFDEKNRALGVVVSGGKALNPLHRVTWQSVFFVTGDGTPGIVRARGWPDVRDRAVTAVQCGPRLVVDGERNEVARAEPSARSGVCIDPEARVVFFATPPERELDVHETAALAAGPLSCRDAMLFDGGPSTQMFLRREGGALEVRGDERVPAYVVVRADK